MWLGDASTSIIDAVRLARRASPPLLVLSVITMIAQALLTVAVLGLFALVVAAISDQSSSSAERAANIRWSIVLLTSVALLSHLVRLGASAVAELHAHRISDLMHRLLQQKSIDIDLEYYDNHRYYDTQHRAQSEAPQRPAAMVDNLMRLGQGTTCLAGVMLLLGSFDWRIAGLALISPVFGLLIKLRNVRKGHQLQLSHTQKERESWYHHSVITRDVHAKEVRLFALGAPFMERFTTLRRQMYADLRALARHRVLSESLAQLPTAVIAGATLIHLADGALAGEMAIAVVILHLQGFLRAQQHVQEVASGLSGLLRDRLFFSHFHDFMALEKKVAEPVSPQPFPRPLRTGISFAQVSFTYPEGRQPVLQGIDLTIRPGQLVALVGENGSGKSTLIKLLCRLYDPTAGTIAIDGVDLRGFATADLRSQISTVFQDHAKYHLSLDENIRLGAGPGPAPERFAEACRASGVDLVAGRLPQGFATRLGRWFATGEELSGGEWQRVALARALMRPCQILIFDEPSSALDADAEHRFFSRLRDLGRGRISILVSHRLANLRQADCILVLDGGRIRERGTHDQLIGRQGLYARLFALQAAAYRDGIASSTLRSGGAAAAS
jgi:ATP-binding cassette subfamily B protein